MPLWTPPLAGNVALPTDIQIEYIEQLGVTYEGADTYHARTMSFGDTPPAGYDRYIVACYMQVESGGSFTISSMTIDGNSCSMDAFVSACSGVRNVTAVGMATSAINSGTSGTCRINFTSSRSGDTNWSTYRVLVGQGNTDFSSTKHDSGNDYEYDPSTSIDVPSTGGFIVACTSSANGGPSISWTGVNEDFQADFDYDDDHGSGHKWYASGATNHTVQANQSEYCSSMTAVSWG